MWKPIFSGWPKTLTSLLFLALLTPGQVHVVRVGCKKAFFRVAVKNFCMLKKPFSGFLPCTCWAHLVAPEQITWSTYCLSKSRICGPSYLVRREKRQNMFCNISFPKTCVLIEIFIAQEGQTACTQDFLCGKKTKEVPQHASTAEAPSPWGANHNISMFATKTTSLDNQTFSSYLLHNIASLGLFSLSETPF